MKSWEFDQVEGALKQKNGEVEGGEGLSKWRKLKSKNNVLFFLKKKGKGKDEAEEGEKSNDE